MLYKQEELETKTMVELYRIARELEIPYYSKLRKAELVFEIVKTSTMKEREGQLWASGILDITSEGYGFLRPLGYTPSYDDIYVSQSQIRKFDLRSGDRVEGWSRKPKENERFFGLLRIEKVNGQDPNLSSERLHFDGLTPIYPQERIKLENGPDTYAMRMIDLVAPLGKGQRGLIVAPPKAGKTELIKQVANSIAHNNPEIEIIILLIDERPEEVTDIERSVKAEVISSTFDEPPENHVKVAELTLERVKRVVESKKDVIVLLDSITRLARAYNLVMPPSGRLLSGGVDPSALHKPKRFFGAARNVEEGGSLTILASALIETGSRMDEVIFEEFKGTGNMELILDRKLAERRIYPALDIKRSGTRKEELLLTEKELSTVWQIRKVFSNLDTAEATETLLDGMKRSNDNEELCRLFFKNTNRSQ